MKPSKETIIKKHMDGKNNRCSICNKQIYESDIENDQIEYSKSKRGVWTFFHKRCFMNSISEINPYSIDDHDKPLLDQVVRTDYDK